MTFWAVYAPLTFAVVEALTPEDAKQRVLEVVGHPAKPWLAREWDVHEATLEEKRRYAAMADAYRPSRPTAQTAKEVRKTQAERLGLFDEREAT